MKQLTDDEKFADAERRLHPLLDLELDVGNLLKLKMDPEEFRERIIKLLQPAIAKHTAQVDGYYRANFPDYGIPLKDLLKR